MSIDKDDWISRCANRYMSRALLPDSTAKQFAEACFENRLNDDDDPEDAADEDMSYWQDDGDES